MRRDREIAWDRERPIGKRQREIGERLGSDREIGKRPRDREGQRWGRDSERLGRDQDIAWGRQRQKGKRQPETGEKPREIRN